MRALALTLSLVLATGCATTTSTKKRSGKKRARAPEAQMDVSSAVKDAEAALLAKHGPAQAERIRRGLAQVAAQWRKGDGDLVAFATAHFVSDPALLDQTFARFEAIFEQVGGAMNEISRELRRPTDVDLGPMLPIDPLLGAFDPSAHLQDDLFQSGIAFAVLLNFPLTTLTERTERADRMSRREWAEVRLAQRFASRVPSDVNQEITRVLADADLYISSYNLWMHHVLAEDGRRLFPSGKRLISHWNLRDELKANYGDPDGLAKQRTIVKVMEHIVAQTLPAAVIDNPHVDWNPWTNALVAAPKETVEADAPAPKAVAEAREDDVRYAKLLANFRAMRRADRYHPTAPNAVARSYELYQELPEARVRALFTEVLASPLVPRVAKLISERLGRPLGPQDLWYSGFKVKPKLAEAELDQLTQQKYPNPEAFAADMANILVGLEFPADRAQAIAEKIRVDPSRGAGHAMPALRRGDFPRLRTRIEKTGMNYKGYNIAIHELGHNVEQVISLYDVDHTLLAGVPNNAFTEALAFVFQARDLELLGLVAADAEVERMRVLADFWATWEIAGVALVDTDVWHWMYEHPDATPAELREATLEIAKRMWAKYYAPVLGGGESALLGIYSHMISYPLYLSAYPLGHLIAFQIEEQVKRAGKLGPEFERMAKVGSVLPDSWMKAASGEPVSAGPLLRATEAALTAR